MDRPAGLTGRIDDVAGFPGKSNRDEEAINENAGALAGATGAEHKAGELRAATCRERELDAMPFRGRHRSAARTVLYALMLGGEERNPWHDCAFALHARLTKAERIGLAFAALAPVDQAAFLRHVQNGCRQRAA